ncbi:MAG TPA: pilus assembly protein N-terminal domain-containing protein, partial [bacterium]|nr:pilus assembly protein N-terminal domain-containing protein [bacterium]
MKGNSVTTGRGLALLLAFLATFAGTGMAAGAPVPITAVQVEDSGAALHLVAAGTPTPTISRLANPTRTVIDLSPARLAVKGSSTVSLAVNSDAIQRVRVGQFQSQTVRVVVEHPKGFGLLLPQVTTDGQQVGISFEPPTPGGTGLPAPSLPVAAGAAPAMLADLPLEVSGDATGTGVLFKYPDAGSYTVWLERFPNRLLFETPARPKDVTASSLRYVMQEMAVVDQGLVNDVRIYKSADDAYTKVVLYLEQYATWQEELTPAGITVTIRPADAPRPAATSDGAVPYSGKDWVAPGTEPALVAAESIPAIDGTPAPAEAPSALDPPAEIRITAMEASDGMENAVEGLAMMGGGTGDKLEEGTQGMPDKFIADEDDERPGGLPGLQLMKPEGQAVAPMPALTAPDLYLFKGESVIVPVERLVRTAVGDPEVLTVNVLSQSELLITAKAAGRTSLITWEEGKGRTIRTVGVSVSTADRTQELAQVLNDQGIRVSFVGDKSVVLEGTVATEEQRVRAGLIAAGAAETVVNLIELASPNQILIKVRMVELNNRDREQLYRQLGAGSRTENGDFSFSVLGDIFNPDSPGGGLFDLSLRPGIVNSDNVGDLSFDPIDLMLNLLETERRARVLSQPNIVTLSGHEAKFRVGGEVPYTFRNENGFNVVDFREFGIELIATPLADSNGNIRVALNPTVRTVDNSLAVAGIPGFRTRTVQTEVQLGDGQTLVIGGLIQREVSVTKSKVPLLG